MCAPELKHGSKAWVVSKPGGKAILETSDKSTADKCASIGYRVEVVGDYLARLNREIKERDSKL